jgi:hypothetical protein
MSSNEEKKSGSENYIVHKSDVSTIQANQTVVPVGGWPQRPVAFGELLNQVEAAQYLRLDETGRHRPKDAIRTLNYFRDHGWLRATKYARQVWYRKTELDRFLQAKTEGDGHGDN